VLCAHINCVCVCVCVCARAYLVNDANTTTLVTPQTAYCREQVQYSSGERSMQQEADPSTRPEQPPDSTFTVNCVGTRVPSFWPENPAMWFAHLEGRFALSNITQDASKLYYVISQLDNKYAAEMEDVITKPPPTGRYDRIKAELIRRLSLSEKQRVRQLLMHDEMSNRRPTQFLRHLRTLAGPSVPSDFFRTLWTNRLPPNIRIIIATQVQVPLNDVVQVEDKIAEVTSSPCVARVSSCGDVSTLAARIDELAREAAALSVSASHPRSLSQTRRHSRHSSCSAGRSPASGVCWYCTTAVLNGV